MFKNLKSFFTGRDSSKHTAPAVEEPAASVESAAPAPQVPAKKSAPAPASPKEIIAKPSGPSPEELCGITSKMQKDEIRQRLAVLYRRYNRATGSLDANLRAESDKMLTAVVKVREKVFGPI